MNAQEMAAAIWSRATRARSSKLNVFVSSTFLDLREEREAVRDAIRACGCNPTLAEETDMLPGESIQGQIPYWLRDAHVLVLLVAIRYGEISPSQVSWTEQEVRTASSIKGMRIYPYFVSKGLPSGVEFDSDKQARLAEFKKYLEKLPGECCALSTPPQRTKGTVDLQLRVARDLGACQSDSRIREVVEEMLSLWRKQTEQRLRSEDERYQDTYDDSFLG